MRHVVTPTPSYHSFCLSFIAFHSSPSSPPQSAFKFNFLWTKNSAKSWSVYKTAITVIKETIVSLCAHCFISDATYSAFSQGNRRDHYSLSAFDSFSYLTRAAISSSLCFSVTCRNDSTLSSDLFVWLLPEMSWFESNRKDGSLHASTPGGGRSMQG